MSMEPLTHEQLQLAFLDGRKIVAQCPTNRYLASLEIEVDRVHADCVHLRHPFGPGTTIVPANAEYIRYYIYNDPVTRNMGTCGCPLYLLFTPELLADEPDDRPKLDD